MPKRKTRKPQRQKNKAQKRIVISPQKEPEILGILLILMSILIFVALYSYNPSETPAHLKPGVHIHNQLGWAGVYISHALIRWTIGYPILVLPFIIFAWGWNRLLQKETRQLKRWSGLALLFAFYISVAFALHDSISALDGPPPAFSFSGYFGGVGANILLFFLGQYGAIIVLIGIILLTVLLVTTISLSDLLQSIESFLTRQFYRLSGFFSTTLKRKSSRPRIVSGRGYPPQETAINQRERIPITPFTPPAAAPPFSRPQEEAVEEGDEIAADENPPDDVVEPSAAFSFSEYNAKYKRPPLELLAPPPVVTEGISEEAYHMNAQLLEEKLEDFGIGAKVIEIHPGPVITLYELELAPGIRVSRVISLADDLAMVMRAKRIRIVAPIPGKSAIGIEIPNPAPEIVYLREIIDTPEFRQAKSPLTIALGKTIAGKPYLTDLAVMPHLLVAGSTGSGKSVCLNTIIMSFIYKATPAQVQMVMIDPKRLELSNYAKLFKHHLTYVEGAKQKVATNAKSAIQVLKSVELEMERRYSLLAAAGVRNLEEYNERISEGVFAPEGEDNPQPLYYMIVIVDELADLMLTSSASRDVEEPIARLTQMSRAVGIHLILATQRPSVDVITGVIKANFPARIAFQVASKVDSRTILDMNGAEKLLGRGDMLFLPPASPEPIRLHNAYISLNEIEEIIEFIRHQEELPKLPLASYKEEEEEVDGYSLESGERDPLFDEAMKVVVLSGQGSVSIVQRKLKVGYSRAARIIDQLEEAGIVGPFEGSKARDVLISPAELEAMNYVEEDDDEGEDEDESI
ncbi:DNA translocase FtsK 4TM domain-containing protein [candidate division KSB1 bacterium]|nr:DNA translocase FtsK 4TM domain-containing protein [candidate division KSB1 bacterium]RQW07543.1 MAG: DNA translocase FtsK [candidate division KSB1 bacterium]